MALAAVGSLLGFTAGLLGLLAFGLGWTVALALWFGGAGLGLAAAVAAAALTDRRAPSPARAPQAV